MLFVSYILMAYALLKLIRVLAIGKTDYFYPVLSAAFIAVVLSCIYVRMFASIGAADRLRGEIIAAAVENQQTEIVLPILPYSDYCWTTVPANEKWEKKFKAFYHIPEDISLRFE